VRAAMSKDSEDVKDAVMIARLLRTIAMIEGRKAMAEYWQPLFDCLRVR